MGQQNLLNQRVSSVDAEASERSGSIDSGGITRIIQDLINRKGLSKVVDAEGNPLVVYHGTNFDVTEFNTSAGWNGESRLGPGAYFTPREEMAKEYGENVVPAYLSLKNPYVTGTTKAPDYHYIGPKRSAELKSQGYDGVILLNDRDQPIEYVAFRPEQIKSAISNTGEFDSNDPNILHSLQPNNTRLATEFLNEIANHDDLYSVPVSKSSSLATVMSEVYPEAEYLGDMTREDERTESKADHRYGFRLSTPIDSLDFSNDPRDFYVYTTDDRKVWIDVSRLETGDGGQRIYAAVANWAFNTGRKFVGDPYGLSADAVIRRTSAMLSSAFRFGTTDHFEPAQQQLWGIPEEGIEPIDWSGSDFDRKQALIHTFVTNILNAFPSLNELRYDFPSNRIIDRRGRVYGNSTLEAIADRGKPVSSGVANGGNGGSESAKARAGIKTLRRAILLKSLMETEAGREPGILEAAYRLRPGALSQYLGGPLFSLQEESLDEGQLGGGRNWIERLSRIGTQEGRRSLITRLNDHVKTHQNFNWWNRTIGTQYEKAMKNPYFGKVFFGLDDFLDSVSKFANAASDLAPGLIPRSESFKDIFRNVSHYVADKRDAEAIADPVFIGTLNNRVWSDAELRGEEPLLDAEGYLVTGSDGQTIRFSLTPEQIDLYRQFHTAKNKSLDDLAMSEMARVAKVSGLDIANRDLSLDDAARFYIDQFVHRLDDVKAEIEALHERHKAERELLDSAHDDDAGNTEKSKAFTRMVDELRSRQSNEKEKLANEAAMLEGLRQDIEGKADKIAEMKRNGYSPLMRFGRFTVEVSRVDPDTGAAIKGDDGRIYFGMFESEAEANKVSRELKEEYGDDAVINQGVISEDAFKQFAGVSPESLELIAQMSGMEAGDAFQQYLKLAVSNRSALKRLIKRKGTPGFEKDVTRTLASFIVQNSRLAAKNWHTRDILQAVADVPKEQGDTKDEVIRLAQYVLNPSQDPSQKIRGMLFANYLGGSIASALVNMTQAVTMTYPYLHQFGESGKHLIDAMKVAGTHLRGKEYEGLDADTKKAMELAKGDKNVFPQEIHTIMGEGSRQGLFTHNRLMRNFMSAWGSLFSLAEQFNRETTFIAAFKMAQENPDVIKQANVASAYEFARKAVIETQGIYDKHNRPNWARNPVGATVFTFKQFSIAYLEFIKRLPKKEKAIALGILMLAAGSSGLPGSGDAEDLFDTIAQFLGYNVQAKQKERELMAAMLGNGVVGRSASAFVLHGVSAFLPIDVSSRLGVSNIIPGTGLFKRSNTDSTRDLTELVGPVGGLIQSGKKAWDALESSGPMDAVIEIFPLAVKNLLKGTEMFNTGEYRDYKGRKVTDATPMDAFWKGIGFQPEHISETQLLRRIAQDSIALSKKVASDAADKWARGIHEGKPDLIRDARADIDDWNRKNPESRAPFKLSNVQRRVREMNTTGEARMLRQAPKEMRGNIYELLNQDDDAE